MIKVHSIDIIYFFIHSLGSFFALCAGIAVYYQNRRSQTNRFFFLFASFAFLWLIPSSFIYTFQVEIARLLLLQMMGGVLMSLFFFYFSKTLIDENYHITGQQWFYILPPVLFCMFNLFRLINDAQFRIWESGVHLDNYVLVRKADIGYYAYTIILCAYFFSGIAIQYNAWKKEPDKELKRRNAILFFSMASMIPLLLIFFNILTLIGLKIHVLYAFLYLYIVIVIQALTLISHRAWKVEYLLDLIKAKEIENENLIKDLQSALAEVKRLSGLLPICSFCKKIRNDQGYWEQIEQYIHSRSDANFSHGVCPECMNIHYKDLFDK